MGGAVSVSGVEIKNVEELITKAKEILAGNPGNRCAKYLADPDVVAKLTEMEKACEDEDEEKKKAAKEVLARFVRCVKTGIENVDSGLGCYAQAPKDYSEFGFFFDKVIGDYHKDDANFAEAHETNWDTGDSKFDLKTLGLTEDLSMRVRVGRNLKKYPLPGSMTKDDRINFEKDMNMAFEEIKKKFGGKVYSMTPEYGESEPNPNLIDAAKYDELVKAHVMFKDMDADPYLKSAGISSDWPYGRGCWQSEEKDKIIWFGEEDQLRIMCMKKGSVLNEVFLGLKDLLDTIEAVDGIVFAKHDRFGYVTSCPSNLGTGMRASVHVKLPNLTSDGTDKKAKEVAGPLGLSVRGTGGEHTPIGADGTVDISPRARLFIKESEIIGKLMDGLKLLLEAESSATPQAENPDKSAEETANEKPAEETTENAAS